MYIAVCDDNPQDLAQIADILNQYNLECAVPIRFELFSDAEQMLTKAASQHFTHYFLDVVMPSMNGIDAAEKIRSFDENAKLVFLTSFTEYAYQSYRVKAYDYLLKPLCGDQLHALLSQLQALESAVPESLCIQSGRSFFKIPFAQLAYLEVNQKKLYFYLADGRVLQVAGALSEYEDLLISRREFVKIHRSYIVNLSQIASLSPGSCVTLSQKNLPISRLLYQSVQSRFMEHLFSRTEG